MIDAAVLAHAGSGSTRSDAGIHPGWAWLRMCLLAAVAMGTLLAWHSRPSTVDQQDLVQAASEKRVVAATQEGPRTVLWVRDDARRFRTELSPFGQSGLDLPSTPAAMIADVEARQNRPLHHRGTLLPMSVHLVVGVALLGLLLAVLVRGPAPRGGNRWFWFWVLAIPVVGPMAFLALSGPLPSGQRLFPGLDRRRRGGVIGLGFLLAAIPFVFLFAIAQVTLPDLIETLLT